MTVVLSVQNSKNNKRVSHESAVERLPDIDGKMATDTRNSTTLTQTRGRETSHLVSKAAVDPLTSHSFEKGISVPIDDSLIQFDGVLEEDSAILLDGDDFAQSKDLNVSDLSTTIPVRNLMTAFAEMNHKESVLSPTDVKNFAHDATQESVEKFNDKELPPIIGEPNPFAGRIDIPDFQLYLTLKLSLPQPVINRCSLYSAVYGVNKEVHDMVEEDQNCNIEETQDDDSPLVQAINGPAKDKVEHSDEKGNVAILDEEQFLLAAIRSRTANEMSIRSCPTSFAEAMGEVDPNNYNELVHGANGQTPNPLSVLAPSRTQLWKPSRSWWEAKSGKNPWIEPKSHNKRWRYLWPLIHYHKFLAKCIKKLKRNNIDVKTCLSPVSAFLREEVCAVSGHLAASSKFTSEEWMEGLPHFNGWTSQDPKSQQQVRAIIAKLPMRNCGEPVDLESPLLRSQIDECFLKAMDAAKKQMASGEQYQYESNSVESNGQVANVRAEYQHHQPISDAVQFHPSGNQFGQNPNAIGQQGLLKGAHCVGNTNGNGSSRPPKGKPPQGKKNPNSSTKQRRNRKKTAERNAMIGGYHMAGWPNAHQMMSQPPNMYPPSHYPYNPQPPSGNFPTGNEYSFSGFSGPPGMYGNEDYSHVHPPPHGPPEWGHPMNGDMHYYNQWEQPARNGAQYFQAPTGPIPNWPVHENSPIHSEPPQVITGMFEHVERVHGGQDIESTVESTISEGYSDEVIQTPLKSKPGSNTPIPVSPYWAHLGFSTLAMSGVATPQGGHQPASPFHPIDNSKCNKGEMNGMNNSKPLLINAPYNYHHQGNAVNLPPSPATQFLMSPQTNPRNMAYFAQTMTPHLPPTFSHLSVQQRTSPDLSASDHELDAPTDVSTPPRKVETDLNADKSAHQKEETYSTSPLAEIEDNKA